MASTTELSIAKPHRYGLAALGVLLLMLLNVVLVPSWRKAVRESLVSPEREVLAALNVDLGRTGQALQVIKVAEGSNLFIEIYEDATGFGSQRLDRKILAGSKNAYFTFRGESTSLALTDLDNDGLMEIVTPTFEGGLVARMNVFKYIPSTKSLMELKNVPLPGERAHQN